MELVEKYIKKYASVTFITCAEDPLTRQFYNVIKQCETHNNELSRKLFQKDIEKRELSNLLSMFLRMKEIAEQKELEWKAERTDIIEQLDKLGQCIMAVASHSEKICECDTLSEEIVKLTKLNTDLQERLNECEVRYGMGEQLVICMEEKEMQRENVIASLKADLWESESQLLNKEQCILSLKAQGIQDKCNCYRSSLAHVCPLEVDGNESQTIELDGQTPNIPDSPLFTLNQVPSILTPRIECRQSNPQLQTKVNNHSNSAPLTIQDRNNLCHILGHFDTSTSPVILSNKLEAVTTQYNLGNRDACALLRAWLPSQLAAQLRAPVGTHKGVSPDVDANWGNSGDRLKELQYVMCCRDARGTSAIANASLKEGDDPILFCTEYLALYKITYNCPNMSPDDADFLYSMANKCTLIDSSTRITLRNASSYTNFVNILKDWFKDSNHKNATHNNISMLTESQGKQRFLRRFKCGKFGYIIRECVTSMRDIRDKNYFRRQNKISYLRLLLEEK
ncbi:posterior protein-like [Bombina bombina]|uniref:posterior protein-like n=1 Tax=Bombina bombina TaxID=8345 RepID=UPI00235A8302|nr:posterior protein-like [Bombina bombina]